ncbi:MAG: helix-hairpin-helix domain-containing protein [Pseudomonadota bacterium]
MRNQVNRQWAWARAALLMGCSSIAMATGVLASEQAVVNINEASAQILAEHLSGVGETTAARIVAYREANGPFQRIEDLVLVQGIGERLLQRNRPRLVLSEAPQSDPAPRGFLSN